MKNKLQKLIEKVKNNKKIQFLLLGVAVSVILLVYIAYFVVGKPKEENNSVSDITTNDYVASLEKKLENVIANIKGVGKVNVAITISKDFVYEYAYEDDEKTNLLLANKEPIILSSKLPEVLGVLVVAEGGGDIRVKLDILSSISTLVAVPNENITILNGEF